MNDEQNKTGMSDTDASHGRFLLQELERKHGRFRLDKSQFVPKHDDREWARRAFGYDIPDDVVESAQTYPLTLFDNPMVALLQRAASVLLAESAQLASRIDIGMTSIPIFNACAIRRHNASVIGINNRLPSVLCCANALAFHLEERLLKGDRDAPESLLPRIIAVLGCAGQLYFDDAMADNGAPPSFMYYRISLQMTLVQMLFIVLHEYGHFACGHHASGNLWVNCRSCDDDTLFFDGNIEAEYEADEFAATHLFDYSRWRELPRDLYMLDSASDPRALQGTMPGDAFLPSLVGQLMTWFHTMSPIDRESFYNEQHSHPHPLDRVSRYVKIMKQFSRHFDYQKFENAVRQQESWYCRQSGRSC